MKSVVAGPAARIEHRSGEAAFSGQAQHCWLRPAKIPRRRAVVVRRIPGQSRLPFVTGRVSSTERIVSTVPRSLRHLRPLLQLTLAPHRDTWFERAVVPGHNSDNPYAADGEIGAL